MRTSIFAALALVLATAMPACAIDATSTDSQESVGASDDELAMTTGKFETFAGQDGKTYFHLLAGNGEKILGSEGYSSVGAATSAIMLLQAGAIYEQRTAKSGEWYFVAKAGNGAVIGTSEMYVSKANAERGAATVAKVASRSKSVLSAPSGAEFQVFQGLDKQYYFHLRAANGEIVLASEGYSSRASATNGAVSAKSNGAVASRFELREAASGAYYFVLKAGNGAIVAHGETYASKSNAQRGIDGVAKILAAN